MEDCPAFCCSFQDLSAPEEESKDEDGDGGEPAVDKSTAQDAKM